MIPSLNGSSLVAQMVDNLPAMWETRVWSLGLEYPPKERILPTPVFLPGEFHGQRSLVGYSPWHYKELDMTERLTFSLSTQFFHFIRINPHSETTEKKVWL